MIEQIQIDIQKKKLEKVNKGEYKITLQEDIIPILEKYGVYEESKLKLTTEEKIEIYLYEIMELPINEILDISYVEDVLKLEEKINLSENGYKYEYTTDNGNTWTEYTQEVTIETEEGIKVRILNSEGEVVSKEYEVTKGQTTVQTDKLQSISILQEPNKTEYKQGESFEIARMTVIATYGDGTSKEITEYTYEPNTALTVNDKYITITYTEEGVTKTIKQEITVTNKLTTISIKTLPDKTKYVKGESFNPYGLEIETVYEDGTSRVVTEYTYSPVGALDVADTKVTVSYEENGEIKTIEVPIEVTNEIVKLEVTSYPDKQVYAQGDTFETAGMIITAINEDTYGQVVDNSNIQVLNGDNLQKGQTSVTIQYTQNNITVEEQIPVAVTNNLVSIEVQASKTEYIQGESVEKENLTVTATYEDDSTKEITEYEITNGSNLEEGQSNITIEYTEAGIQAVVNEDGTITTNEKEYTASTTVDISVTNKLVAVEYKSGPTKKTYNHDDTFETAGLVLTATYEDGSTKEITSGITGPAQKLTYNQTSIIVSYTEGGITKQATVTGITVNRVLQSIAVTTSPKLTYNYGDSLSTSGMVVEATYTDGGKETVTGYTTSPENGATLSHSDTTLTVTYEGKTATKAITVNKVLSKIAVTTAPTKTAYTVGEKFSTAGMVVTATYSDNSTGNVTSSCTFNPTTSTALTTSHTSVTITYDGKTTSQAITVTIPTLGSQISKSNYGQAVNYSANGKTDWQIYYATSEYIFLIASSSIGNTSLSNTGDVTAANNSNVYKIMKLGQTGYTLDSSWNSSKAVATLVNGYSAYANTEGYKDASGNSYVVGAIGGPTIELVQARANTIKAGAITLGTSTYGYSINGTTYVDSVSTGIPTDKTYIWMASPLASSYFGDLAIYMVRANRVGGDDYRDSYGVCPVVCLKSSIPATWNGSAWEI